MTLANIADKMLESNNINLSFQKINFSEKDSEMTAWVTQTDVLYQGHTDVIHDPIIGQSSINVY
ncbi:hypothetical protein CI610_02536 [invertebrate metagenome]|uniref:Uncharacterized protein n=1 Tax=invertebrate metagenome TaxID=1711999 RepID=A0A2H9T5N8_9ZZZZ